MTKAALGFVALLICSSTFANAGTAPVSNLHLEICPGAKQNVYPWNYFDIIQSDGSFGSMPFRNVVGGVDSSGAVTLTDPSTQVTLNLGKATAQTSPDPSQGQVNCSSYRFLFPQSTAFSVDRAVTEGTPYDCINNGPAFPQSAACRKDIVQLTLSQGNVKIQFQCTDIFELNSDGSIYSRQTGTGGDCSY